VASKIKRVNKRTLSSALLMGLLFVVMIASLVVLGTLALRLDEFKRYYHWLLFINGLALLFIAGVIIINGLRLMREFRQRVAGSRLTVKLVVLSVLLANFDLEIEGALDDALELSRESLGLQMRTLQRDTLQVAQQLVGVNDSVAVVALNSLSAETDATEMTLIGPNNRIIASTGLLGNIAVQPNRPADDIISRARSGIPYVGIDPAAGGDLNIVVVTPVFSEAATGGNSVLQALFPVASRSAYLAETVQQSYQQYRELVFLRRPLIVSSMLTLSLALLLSVMMAVWFALYAARRMMMPVHDLVEGTRAVADGNYATRIYKRSKNDELGFLVQSFNYMTQQLEQARTTADSSQRQVERQRAYLQAVLGQISSGVLTLDAQHCVRTSNLAAVNILGAELAHMQGHSMLGEPSQLANPIIAQFVEQIQPRLISGAEQEWSDELEVVDETGRRYLFCRCATLLDVSGDPAGMVIVVDDMTTIISAQRDAAWSEVARRLAHEIKNPLTPIQLSAERLRHKFSDKVSDEDATTLGRLTQTIENQVDALKSMVNAFAEYASAPKLALQETDMNLLLQEVAELYSDNNTDRELELELSLSNEIPPVAVDLPRMRQLFHNLIKNALEAQQDSDRRYVGLGTRVVHSSRGAMLEISVKDEGPGFPLEMLNRLFEPYVTSKTKGTGLGLAIVKKIVEEHNGTVTVKNRVHRGAVASVQIPLSGALQIRGDAA